MISLSVTLIFAADMLATVVTHECITAGGLSPTQMAKFCSVPSPYYSTTYHTLSLWSMLTLYIKKTYCYSSYIIVGCFPWPSFLLRTYLVNYCKITFVNDFTGWEIMYDFMALILTHRSFKALLPLCMKYTAQGES